VNVAAADVPPPGLGLATVTFAFPTEVTSVAGMVAVISVALTHEDDSAAPFHSTVALFSKFEPYSTKLTAEAPAVVLEGAIAASVGVS
jgi:hypothetical protein